MEKLNKKKVRSSTSGPTQQTNNSSRLTPYPFTAIVGQEEMKLALILNVVDPLIGGVLIMGHRGTGKSTAVRSLAGLLPGISVVAGCPYNCDPKDRGNLCSHCIAIVSAGGKLLSELHPVPVVELPLGATEDRVCGTIDIERALNEGKKAFDPGLLARANRGFLYIDEVNLLEDHLVDLLLDVAATGRNKVEREAVSIEHPASFVLIGSGNPEEGELRPQLLDRFGLHVEVTTENYLVNRVTIVERRDEFDRNQDVFVGSFAVEQRSLLKQIERARNDLRNVKLDRPLLTKIAQVCADLQVDGHRGELTIMRSARALAAFEGRKKVLETDVRRVSGMSLRHRLRRDALEETATTEQIEQTLEGVFPSDQPNDDSGETEGGQVRSGEKGGTNSGTSRSRNGSRPNTSEVRSPNAVENRLIDARLDDELRPGERRAKSGQTSRRLSKAKAGAEHNRGRYTRAVSYKAAAERIALDATLRAVAMSMKQQQSIDRSALRYKLLKHKQGTLFIFAIDTSGSMAANRIARAKSTILKLLRKSYLNRDSVAIVSFHGTAASVDLAPSRSILRARRVLDSLPMGGSTPLSAGLATAVRLIKQDGDKFGHNVLLLFTDGRSNVALRRRNNIRAQRQQTIEGEIRELDGLLQKSRTHVVVVDTQRQFESSEETRRLAEILHARFIKIDPNVGLS